MKVPWKSITEDSMEDLRLTPSLGVHRHRPSLGRKGLWIGENSILPFVSSCSLFDSGGRSDVEPSMTGSS